MKSLRLLSFLFFITIGTAYPQTAQFDLSGLPLFWEIAEILQSDRMPTQDEWDRLFSHPAYAQIDRQGQRKRRLKHNLPIVFMPSKKTTLDSILTQSNGFNRRMCTHLKEAAGKRKELNQYAQKLQQSDLPEQAIAAAQNYLPPGITEQNPAPTIYLILFESNGFGGDNIVLDLLNVMNNTEKENLGFIAHEAHHSYSGPIEKTQYPDRNSEHYLLVHAFGGLLSEGIASMLDKQHYPGTDLSTLAESRRPIIGAFNEAFQHAPETLRKMDSLLVKIAAGPNNVSELGKEIHGSLTWGGHPDGMHMAIAIEKAFGRKKLVRLNEDPFAFLMTYSKAAKKLGEGYHVFSKESLSFIKKLEKKYIE